MTGPEPPKGTPAHSDASRFHTIKKKRGHDGLEQLSRQRPE
jgi:hypothetical protein